MMPITAALFRAHCVAPVPHRLAEMVAFVVVFQNSLCTICISRG